MIKKTFNLINNHNSPLQQLKHERRQSRKHTRITIKFTSLNDPPIKLDPNAASNSEDSTSIIDENDGTVMLYTAGNNNTQRSNTDSANVIENSHNLTADGAALRANTVSSNTNPSNLEAFEKSPDNVDWKITKGNINQKPLTNTNTTPKYDSDIESPKGNNNNNSSKVGAAVYGASRVLSKSPYLSQSKSLASSGMEANDISAVAVAIDDAY